MKNGKVWLVGAGPGDKNLLTQKAQECIEKADVIVYDILANPSVLSFAGDECELIFAGKKSGNHYMKQSRTNELISELALSGKNVVRLKGGDPFVFGRGGEEAQVLREKGIPFEIVPGISSCYSAPAYAGIPVTHRDHSSSFHVITGHKKKGDECDIDFELLAKENETQIYLMSLSNLENICSGLIKYGKDINTPVAVIEKGTTPYQKTVVSTLCSISDEVKKQGISTPAMTVVGDVVRLREELKWFEKKELFGKKIVVTGTKNNNEKLSGILSLRGAAPVEISLISAKENDAQHLKEIAWDKYTWIVFTSSNGVEIFTDQLRKTHTDIRKLSHLKFAAIGKGTASTLEKHNIYADVVPEKYESRYLAEKMIPLLNENDRVLLMRAENGTTVLQDIFRNRSIACENYSLYKTVTNHSRSELLELNIEDADYVVFTSSSAVKAFKEIVHEPEKLKCKFVSIGSVTSQTAYSAGLHIDIEAENASDDDIADAILNDVGKKE